MAIYGQSIKWTNRKDGSITIVETSGHSTPEKAKAQAIDDAIFFGWPGNPKWWQYWRRGDTKISLSEPVKAAEEAASDG